MPVNRAYRCLAILLVFCLLVPIAEAAGLGVTLHQIDTSQYPKVRAFVSVANEQGVRIADLEMDPQAFEVLEDDKPVTGFQVEPIVASQEPVAVALVIDVSGSMKDEGKMEAAKQAASAFVDTMGARDGGAVISFSREVKVVQPYTGDKEALKKAIGGLNAEGATLLYDAIAESAQLMSFVQLDRKVLLLLTDGEDETSKKATLDTAIAGANSAKAPIFAVGLGSGVKRDVLDKLASATGGQAVYVARPDQLRQVFLNLGDQLRRQYVVQYTSQLPGDDKAHSLTVKVKYRGQTGEATGSFTAPRTALAVDVKGIADGAQVTGPQRIEVTVTAGVAKQVELLVDGQSRGKASAAPFSIPWDADQESPGKHQVVVRATDAAGAAFDKEYEVEVGGAAPAAVPTAAPTAAAAAPTPAPEPAPASAGTDPMIYVLAAVAALILAAGAVAAVLFLRRRKPAPPPPVPQPAPLSDRTEDMDIPASLAAPAPSPAARPVAPSAGVAPPPSAGVAQAPPSVGPKDTMASDGSGGTVVSGGVGATIADRGVAAPRMPRARLRVQQQGAERDVIAGQAETILGREEGNQVVIRDALASRKHAKIVIENGEFWIEDLKSLNGTLVNDRLITKQKLASNDRIKIASAVITFTLEQA